MADFEYIIVGSGAGGGPLAANLARKGFKVLLLEAGGDPCSTGAERGRLMYEVPIFHGLSTEFPECQWDYFVQHYSNISQQEKDTKLVTEDPATELPLSDPSIWYPRAGALGGCTTHNAMITVTPQDQDWNDIAALTGDDSWKASNMNKYFQQLEDCHYRPRPGSVGYFLNGLLWSFIALVKNSPDWKDWAHGHGFGGWLVTGEADPFLVLKDVEIIHLLISAAKFALKKHIEHPWLSLFTKLDPNDTRNDVHMREGLAFTPLTVNNGRRNGPRDFLLRTAKRHSNLEIRLHTLVTKVLFEGSERRAVAVRVRMRKGTEKGPLYQAAPTYRQELAKGQAPEYVEDTISASREIILCGGAFNSPQLLMLSGIGPKNEIERLGIKSLVDLPGVGRNLQDRYEIAVISEFPKPFLLLEGATFELPKTGGPEDPCFKEWERHRGIYCANGSLIGILKRSERSLPEPDLYIFGLPGFFKGYQPGYSAKFERQRNRFTWVILKAYTDNRVGTVELQSSDPSQRPHINFNSFSRGKNFDTDLQALVKGVEFVRDMNHTLGKGSEVEIWPPPGCTDKDKLRDFIMAEAWGHHASCSNKIGHVKDDLAVLDSSFRVRHTKALRVVDASVFPKIPGYFIVSAIYMISEKAADVIPQS